MVGGEQIRELHFETAHEIPAPPILRKGEKGKISRSAMMTGQAEKKLKGSRAKQWERPLVFHGSGWLFSFQVPNGVGDADESPINPVVLVSCCTPNPARTPLQRVYCMEYSSIRCYSVLHCCSIRVVKFFRRV
jgi:hypothetical protein